MKVVHKEHQQVHNQTGTARSDLHNCSKMLQLQLLPTLGEPLVPVDRGFWLSELLNEGSLSEYLPNCRYLQAAYLLLSAACLPTYITYQSRCGGDLPVQAGCNSSKIKCNWSACHRCVYMRGKLSGGVLQC